jgi:DNA mismatch endonuclease (patch repair protein)
MVDVLTRAQRSFNMSRIRSKDTSPELFVRRLVHALGFRYRLHSAELPGRPDLVFTSRRKVIFVHGCYWHMHACDWGRVTPKTNAAFWQTKRMSNVERDRRNLRELGRLGWHVLVVWECSLRKPQHAERRITKFLERSHSV